MSHVPTVLKSDRSVFDKMLPGDDNAAVVIGGWGIYMLIIAPRAPVYRNWNLEILITWIKKRSLNS